MTCLLCSAKQGECGELICALGPKGHHHHNLRFHVQVTGKALGQGWVTSAIPTALLCGLEQILSQKPEFFTYKMKDWIRSRFPKRGAKELERSVCLSTWNYHHHHR
jgi:hypothetical protein